MLSVNTTPCLWRNGIETFFDERQRLIEEGKAEFVDWETAKKRISKRVS